MWTKEASAWLKDQKDAFTGQRASAPPRVLPAQEKAKRKELAGEARAFSTEWAGNLAPQMARAPFVVHRGLVPSALRGELLEMHKRALHGHGGRARARREGPAHGAGGDPCRSVGLFAHQPGQGAGVAEGDIGRVAGIAHLFCHHVAAERTGRDKHHGRP